jgi:GNAT superfamily N-acetyltransferase
MSLYADYIKERLDKNIVETDDGFATFLYLDQHVYIEDIYVVPEKRQAGVAKFLADKVLQQARQKGYKKLLGSVCVGTNGAANSLKTLLAYNMYPIKCENQMIYFEKEF